MHRKPAAAILLGVLLGLGLLKGAWQPKASRFVEGLAYTPKSQFGTLNTSATIDITGSASWLAGGFVLINDGSQTIMVEEGVQSVAAMTAASFPVYTGETHTSAVACRYVQLYSPGGSTTYRFKSGY